MVQDQGSSAAWHTSRSASLLPDRLPTVVCHRPHTGALSRDSPQDVIHGDLVGCSLDVALEAQGALGNSRRVASGVGSLAAATQPPVEAAGAVDEQSIVHKLLGKRTERVFHSYHKALPMASTV
jgi:hypothetical protein